ncbi:MAG: MFS transporter [Candidatus Lokiarchaeota archaeon]|nr:MFS transporter [Candidatus Lokiarchaeota archaeon]MBD3339806.1 MFS transporter [Candidatus Lokiarchaeota archaeon]
MESKESSSKVLVFAAACVGWIHDAFNLTIISLIAPKIVEEFGVGNFEIGLLFSGQFIATFIGALVFGSLADRIGRKPALIFSVLWDSIITTLSAFSPNFWFLFFTRIFSGMGVSWGVGYTLIAEVWGKKPKRRGLAGGVLHSTFVVGFVISTVVASVILPLSLPYGSWRYCFLFSLFPIPLLILFQIKMRETEIMVEYKKTVEEQGRQIRKVPILNVFKKKEQIYFLVVSAIMLWMSQLIYHHLVDFGPYYFTLLGSEALGRLMVLLVGMCGTISIISFGALSDYIGRKLAFFIATIIQFVSLSVFIYSVYTDSLQGIIIAYILFGLGQGNAGVQGVWLTELFSTSERASTASTIYSFARGFALSGLFIGIYSDFLILSAGFSPAFAVGVAMSTAFYVCIPLLVLPWFLPETKGKELKSIEEENLLK